MKYIHLILLCFFATSTYFSTQAQTIDTLVTINKQQLHFKIIPGNGTPILFEAGNGDDASVWQALLAPIHEQTGAPLIVYDRAGLGQSSIDTNTISFKREVKHLERALRKLGYQNKLFVVSHSFGAFYTSLLANRNKRRIQGAVYIDPALPCFMTEAWANN
jgi:pimeloyl-ACP methyl ester carboxylesterase